MRRAAVAILLLTASAAASAQSEPTVAEFLHRAEPLERQGAAAMFSPEYTALKQEFKAARNAVRDRSRAEMASGRHPSVCYPEDKPQIEPDELLGYLRSIPPARRNMSLEAAIAGMIKQKYPCPA